MDCTNLRLNNDYLELLFRKEHFFSSNFYTFNRKKSFVFLREYFNNNQKQQNRGENSTLLRSVKQFYISWGAIFQFVRILPPGYYTRSNNSIRASRVSSAAQQRSRKTCGSMTRLDLSGPGLQRMHAVRPHSYTRLWSSRVVLSQTVQCHELLVSCLHVKGGCNGLLYYGDPYIGEQHLGCRAYISLVHVEPNETWMQQHERPWPPLIPIVHLRSPIDPPPRP